MRLFRQLFRRERPSPPAASVPPHHRVYAIGDIHGRADLLERLLGLIEENLRQSPIANPLLIFLGDYVDRGLGARAVLERMALGDFPIPAVTLRGNHESMLIGFVSGETDGAMWFANGGLETLISYGVEVRSVRGGGGHHEAVSALRQAMPESHLQFLRGTRPHFTVGDYFFCHAGVRPGTPLEEQKEADLLWIREPFIGSEEDFGKVVVHGHTPVEVPDFRRNRINIDTGAFISGRLTCLVLENDTQKLLQTGHIPQT